VQEGKAMLKNFPFNTSAAGIPDLSGDLAGCLQGLLRGFA
jgi:hypothetical protein